MGKSERRMQACRTLHKRAAVSTRSWHDPERLCGTHKESVLFSYRVIGVHITHGSPPSTITLRVLGLMDGTEWELHTHVKNHLCPTITSHKHDVCLSWLHHSA